jgi:hypothetical protein
LENLRNFGVSTLSTSVQDFLNDVNNAWMIWMEPLKIWRSKWVNWIGIHSFYPL